MADVNEQYWKSVRPEWPLWAMRMLTAYRLAQQAEKEFRAALAEKDLTFKNVESQLAQYVSSFPSAFTFADFK